MPEGTIVFAGEPVVLVTVRRVEAQLLKTLLLNQINLQTTVAEAARIALAAGRGEPAGRRPIDGNVLVTLKNEVLTHAEKSLPRSGHADAVNHIRHLFQETMEADFREAVERLTGRKVLAFISGNQIDPDIAAELFVFDGPPASRTYAPDRQSASITRGLNTG